MRLHPAALYAALPDLFCSFPLRVRHCGERVLELYPLIYLYTVKYNNYVCDHHNQTVTEISMGYSRIIRNNIIRTIPAAAAFSALFLLMLRQVRGTAQERQDEQSKMITALASDYRSVFYADLDNDEVTVYRSGPEMDGIYGEGDRFPFRERIGRYAEAHVDEQYRDDFLAFTDPDNIRKGLENSKVITHIYLARRNGREFYEMIRIAGVRSPEDRKDGKIHAVGIGFADVDVQTRESMARNRALSDALTAAEEASKAKTAFLSGMSHEIRTPLNAIIGLDNIALNEPGVPEKTREHLEKIGTSAQHLLDIINDILDMSGIESGRRTLRNEEFSMQEMLGQINTMIGGQCAEKGLSYNCRVSDDIDDCYIGDVMKLKQVIINILGNAVKFTPQGGEIEFIIERAAGFEGNTTLRMTMRDTGIGISEEFMPEIFDAFSQEDPSSVSRYGSSGLGLAITRSIVEMMNGSIDVQSEKGRGTTFTVQVTLEDAVCTSDIDRGTGVQDMAAAPAGGDRHETDLSGCRILIAEDVEVNAEILRMMLSMREMRSDHAPDGRIAVDMFLAHPAGYYDAILMDMRMPEMDGLTATAKIRELDRPDASTIPIIALTANAFDEDVRRSLQSGLNAHLTKPVQPEALFETLENLIHDQQNSSGQLLHPVTEGR